MTVVPLSSVRLPATSKITAHPQLPPAPPTGEPDAPEPIPPEPPPEPIYITYLLPAMIVFRSPNTALAAPVPHAIALNTQLVPLAVIPAQPHPQVPTDPAAGLPLPPKAFTKPTIKLAPASQSVPVFCPVPVTCAQPCHPLPLKENVQLVKSQLPCILICNRQFVGVIVSILAAEPAARDV